MTENRKLSRTVFETSRLQEYFSKRELQMQMGAEVSRWPLMLMKELIDNALDACEDAGVMPEISVCLEDDAVSVQDNGPGLPAEILERSLDYGIRVSDKSYYVSPTRGQLGNALKCVWAAPYVASGELGSVEITAHGQKHILTVSLDRIAQTPAIKHEIEPDGVVRNGTLTRMHWPQIAGYLNDSERAFSYNRSNITSLRELVDHYRMFNPHATFTWDGEFPGRVSCTRRDWKKWSPSWPTSPHWYTCESLGSLIAAYLNKERETGRAYTVREFVNEFSGLTGSAKQKRVSEQAGLHAASLHDLVEGSDLDHDRVNALLVAMRTESRPILPTRLGVIGEEHIRQRMVMDHHADESTLRYKRIAGEVNGLPFVLEVSTGIYQEDYQECGRSLVVGVNWSPTLKIPFEELHSLLAEARVDSSDPLAVVVHLACPRLEYTEHGKGALVLPSEISLELEKAIRSVTKQWTAAKRQADRDNRVRERQLEEMRKRTTPLSVKQAAFGVMGQAYKEASFSEQYGALPTNARQIMYAARPKVLELTGGKCWKDSGYFTQTLLPEFMEQCPELTADWDVVWDARGHLIEPHTAKQVPLGGLEVRRYMQSWDAPTLEDTFPAIVKSVATHGPSQRYRYVMFIEKEGFNELFRAIRLTDRYDIALMSTKGMSVTASRQLVERFSEQGVTTLVVHDFDKSGLGILHTLRTNTRRYQFQTRPSVVDLGLRLEDVRGLDLQTEPVEYSGKKDPRTKLMEYGATGEECQFLARSRSAWGHYSGERVELNALGNDKLVSWLERKLAEAGVEKVIPDAQVLRKAYVRAQWISKIENIILESQERLKRTSEDDIPPDLAGQVEDIIEDSPKSWDMAIWELAGEPLSVSGAKTDEHD